MRVKACSLSLAARLHNRAARCSQHSRCDQQNGPRRFQERVFESIRADFTAFFDQLGDLRPPNLNFVPISALTGDNVVHPTTMMPWYTGPSLLELLQAAPAAEAGISESFRFAVQRVLRPNLDFRGFAGQIAAGTIRPGDAIMVLPSRRTTTIRSIVTFDGDLPVAQAPQSVTLTFTDELDISRGDLIVSPESPAATTKRFTASLVWMVEASQRHSPLPAEAHESYRPGAGHGHPISTQCGDARTPGRRNP